MLQLDKTVETETLLDDLRHGRKRVERRRHPRPIRGVFHVVANLGEDDLQRFEILRGAKELLRVYLGWSQIAHA